MQAGRAATNWRPFLYGVGFIAGVLLLLGAAAFGISIAAIVYNSREHQKTIHRTRAIGFSVYKNGTQSITDNTTTIVTIWTSAAGYPAYDHTYGAFNETSGVYTANSKDGTYMVTATICFAASATGIREARLVTSGTHSAIVYDRAVATASITGGVCLNVNQIMDLPYGDTVWVEAFSNSGSTETVTAQSRFSLERIAFGAA